MEGKKRFVVNIISLVFLQGGQYILTLATLPYLARVLSPGEFGIYGFSLAVAQYFVIITNYGFDLSATKRIAESQGDINEVSSVFWNVMASKLLLSFLSILCVGIGCMLLPAISQYSNFIMLAVLQVFGAVLLPSWFFQGKEKLWGVTIANLVARASGLPLFILLVKKPDDLILALFVQVFITLFSGGIAFFIALKFGNVVKASLSSRKIKVLLLEGFPLLVSNLAISLYTVSTIIIMNLTSSDVDVGLFSGIDKIRGAIAGVFVILIGAIYPRVSAMLVKDKNAALVFVKKVAGLQCFLTGICSAGVYFFAYELVLFGLGPDYLPAVNSLKLMAPLVFLVTTSVILANYLILPFGYKKIFVGIPIAMSVIHIIISIPLCYFYGVAGGAEAILFTELMTNILLLFFVYNRGLLKEVFYAK